MKKFFSKPVVKRSLIVLVILCGTLLVSFITYNIVWYNWYQNTITPKISGLELLGDELRLTHPAGNLYMKTFRVNERDGIEKTYIVKTPRYLDFDYKLSVGEYVNDFELYEKSENATVYLSTVFIWPQRNDDYRYGISLRKSGVSTTTLQLYTDKYGNILDKNYISTLPPEENWQEFYDELLPTIQQSFRDMEEHWGNLETLK